MKIAVGNDHTALALKQALMPHLNAQGYMVEDFGASTGESADYPLYAERVADAVAAGRADFGLLLCGTGVGMSLAANKVRGIRAVVCSEPYSARLSRLHNDANILCLGARVVGDELAKMIADAFFGVAFEGGRHARRVKMIMDIERRGRT